MTKKSVEFAIGNIVYELEYDLTDPQNKVLESVTIVASPNLKHLEMDVDVTSFLGDLSDEEIYQLDLIEGNL